MFKKIELRPFKAQNIDEFTLSTKGIVFSQNSHYVAFKNHNYQRTEEVNVTKILFDLIIGPYLVENI